MHQFHDDDEWETVIQTGSHGPGMGWGQGSRRRRDPVEVARIKRARLDRENQDTVNRAWRLMQSGVKPRIRVKAGSSPCSPA